jgi:signal recognition particle subunit SRP54
VIRYAPQPPTVIMLVGLQGCGKTTTAAKLALAIRKEGHRPMLVAADIYRPAAAQQLERLGKDNQIPVSMPESGVKPPELCRRGVQEAGRLNCDTVILDTAGRLQIDEAMLEELKEIRKRVDIAETILVVDAMTGQEAVNVATTFDAAVSIDGVILTKLDGDARGGAALSMREALGKSILYCGVGEKPADLEPFSPDRMASRILGMGDVLSLIEKAQTKMDEEEAREMGERLFAGRLTMDDWLTQMQQVRSMGPLEGILGMLPGGRELMRQAGNQLPSEQELKRMEAMVLSMTPAERRRPDIIKGSRRQRIARGSGNDVMDVNKMLKGFEQAQSMFKAMGGRGSKGMRGKVRMMRQLSKLDPSMLEGAMPGGLPAGMPELPMPPQSSQRRKSKGKKKR